MVEIALELPHGDQSIVYLSTFKGLAQVGLRGNPNDTAFLAGVKRALLIDLPLTPNTVSRRENQSVLWLGPDEWLIVDEQADAVNLICQLSDVLVGQHVSIVNLSASRQVFVLDGPYARGVLEKGCLIDLDPRAFSAGQCAGTIIGQVQIYLELVNDKSAYRLYTRPSYARYLGLWLMDAMAEFVA